MALIKCPQCGCMVSQKADACPLCYTNLRPQPQQDAPTAAAATVVGAATAVETAASGLYDMPAYDANASQPAYDMPAYEPAEAEPEMPDYEPQGDMPEYEPQGDMPDYDTGGADSDFTNVQDLPSEDDAEEPLANIYEDEDDGGKSKNIVVVAIIAAVIIGAAVAFLIFSGKLGMPFGKTEAPVVVDTTAVVSDSIAKEPEAEKPQPAKPAKATPAKPVKKTNTMGKGKRSKKAKPASKSSYNTSKPAAKPASKKISIDNLY